MSATNDTTKSILNFFFRSGIFCYRQNTTGIPIPGGGFRSAAKTGLPDIVAILPPEGKHVGIEVKTGRDRLRPEQIGTLKNIKDMGGVALVVKSYDDFLIQWSDICK